MRIGLPASWLTSEPFFQCTGRERESPNVSEHSFSVKPGMGFPSGVWSSTIMEPAAELAKLSNSSFPEKMIGLVVTSPPFMGALIETKPSIRIVYRLR